MKSVARLKPISTATSSSSSSSSSSLPIIFQTRILGNIFKAKASGPNPQSRSFMSVSALAYMRSQVRSIHYSHYRDESASNAAAASVAYPSMKDSADLVPVKVKWANSTSASASVSSAYHQRQQQEQQHHMDQNRNRKISFRELFASELDDIHYVDKQMEAGWLKESAAARKQPYDEQQYLGLMKTSTSPNSGAPERTKRLVYRVSSSWKLESTPHPATISAKPLHSVPDSTKAAMLPAQPVQSMNTKKQFAEYQFYTLDEEIIAKQLDTEARAFNLGRHRALLNYESELERGEYFRMKYFGKVLDLWNKSLTIGISDLLESVRNGQIVHNMKLKSKSDQTHVLHHLLKLDPARIASLVLHSCMRTMIPESTPIVLISMSMMLADAILCELHIQEAKAHLGELRTKLSGLDRGIARNIENPEAYGGEQPQGEDATDRLRLKLQLKKKNEAIRSIKTSAEPAHVKRMKSRKLLGEDALALSSEEKLLLTTPLIRILMNSALISTDLLATLTPSTLSADPSDTALEQHDDPYIANYPAEMRFSYIGEAGEAELERIKEHVGEGFVPAFRRARMFDNTVNADGQQASRGQTAVNILLVHTKLRDVLRVDSAHIARLSMPYYGPMIIPPKPWVSPQDGGYLGIRQHVMRTQHELQDLALKKASNIPKVFKALDVLGMQSWVINKDVFHIAETLWQRGGNIAGLVSLLDETPKHTARTAELKEQLQAREWSDECMALWKELTLLQNDAKQVKKTNRERYSLRCDTEYKLAGCREYLGKPFYVPHNMDFRGRCYPLPINVQHMGSDLTRAMLNFAEERPLGVRGLYWLKIHLANLMGKDKLSFQDRIDFAESFIPTAIRIGSDPLSDSNLEIWTSQEDPFQLLGVILDLKMASALGTHRMHEHASRIPVHLDGSCNGLQHYAALGRDIEGGTQVNLTYARFPQDIYSAVAERVAALVSADAANGVVAASLVDGKISRKIVKQTVMTSVYGVTYFGSVAQIANRLRELPGFPRSKLKPASQLVARHTMASIEGLFVNAYGIMDWLKQISGLVCDTNNPMSWKTPLGLPLVQPYFKDSAIRVQTVLGDFSVAYNGDKIDSRKQRSAFPPNYVHSLDATHMMMTALDCHDRNLNFASVHDSYWTHACDVDLMGEILREKFIELHKQPLLEQLAEHCELYHPELKGKLPPVPSRGGLDLNNVRNALYFFD